MNHIAATQRGIQFVNGESADFRSPFRAELAPQGLAELALAVRSPVMGVDERANRARGNRSCYFRD